MHRILIEVSDHTGYSGAYTESNLEILRDVIRKFLEGTFDGVNNPDNAPSFRNYMVSHGYVQTDEFVGYVDNVKL